MRRLGSCVAIVGLTWVNVEAINNNALWSGIIAGVRLFVLSTMVIQSESETPPGEND